MQKRGLVPYNDKRILLADLPDGQPNSETHAFGHYSLDAVHLPDHDQPAAGKEMVVVVSQSQNKQYESRLAMKHARVVNKARALWFENGDDIDGKLHRDQLQVAERVAAARPGGVIRIS